MVVGGSLGPCIATASDFWHLVFSKKKIKIKKEKKWLLRFGTWVCFDDEGFWINGRWSCGYGSVGDGHFPMPAPTAIGV